MTHRPIKDPRRMLENRLEMLTEQLESLPPSEGLSQAKGRLDELATGFRNGEIRPEEVCITAMSTYWENQNIISRTEAGHNLATLGHDFGAAANIEFDKLEAFWGMGADFS